MILIKKKVRLFDRAQEVKYNNKKPPLVIYEGFMKFKFLFIFKNNLEIILLFLLFFCFIA